MAGDMNFAVVIEQRPSSYGAHVPNVLGCLAIAEGKSEVCALIREAVDFHVEALVDGQSNPSPPANQLVKV